MKIQISESTDVESFDIVRVIDESGLNRLLLNLLSADSDEDYKLSSIELREFVRPKDENEDYSSPMCARTKRIFVRRNPHFCSTHLL